MQEETSLQPGGAGAFRLYRLTKRGLGTEEVVRHLARRLGVPRASLAYGGRKDRAAVTVQHLSIRGKRDRTLEGEGFQLVSLGFVDRPMGPDAITANHFRVVVRGLDPACQEDVADNARDLARRGVPNYFDDQRFRSVPQHRGFPAALMVRGQWEAAVRLLLTSPEPGAPRREKDRLAHLEAAWGRWEQCLALARSPQERRVIERLARPGGTPAHALAALPREALSMLLTAYQSHLWNRALAAALRQYSKPCVALPGLAGDYLFPADGGEHHPAELRDLVIPTPGPRLAEASPECGELVHRVLVEEGITATQLALRPLRTAFFASTPRRAFVVPGTLALEWLQSGAGRARGAAVRLTFSLPAGSYATMVVRGLLLRRRTSRTADRQPT